MVSAIPMILVFLMINVYMDNIYTVYYTGLARVGFDRDSRGNHDAHVLHPALCL